ncbi:ExeA family protein [Paracidovorax valerianellae]|uniref:General secretion pathway protein A n=1 Tax=Paracidovorax valerianellae TaxID=187868 RepID=A0A1G6ZPP3_9BURK|nr:ExeA family protein [Paracidovorax valerianellae]MDA8444368.1 AAA family ATPase [Paracidovorax valerianellae]SDE04187.1 general secretion pathway protein A [Paracidovorax valerianellae]
MYAPFFGLEHAPFSIAPDPRYLFMSDRHREALAHLLYGLDAGGGFVLLTGEIGTGKTTVCRCFLEQIPAHCNVAYIFNPRLTVGELLRSICDEFGVAHTPAVPGSETVKDCLDPLNAFLLQAHAAGRNNVLIIDEAQNLSADVLEQLRLLTNLETSERKLLQIILIGQPELRGMIAGPSLEQLAQRVIARFHLDALSAEETRQYIAHRMAVAGLQGALPFTARALQRVHALARGVPRRINLLCDRALLGAYAGGVREVTEAIVDQAAREVFDAAPSASANPGSGRAPRWAVAGAGALAGAAAVACAGWALGWWPPAGAVAGTGLSAAPASASASAPAQGASAAAAPASAAASVPAAVTTLQSFLAAQPEGDEAAWRTLATAWGATPPGDGDACAALVRQGLRCFRQRRAGLSLLRQLDRPGVMTLFTADERPVPVVLSRLEGGVATLEGGGRTLKVPVADLGQAWRGEFATLWRAPPGLQEGSDLADQPATLAWLDAQLPAAPEAAGAARTANQRPAAAAQLRARIHRFQLAQGLAPDGRAGPLTLMLLNRAAGVNEPRLRTGA